MLKPELLFPQSHDFSSQQCFPNHSLSVQHHSFRKQESRPEIQLAKSLFHLRGKKNDLQEGDGLSFYSLLKECLNLNSCFHSARTFHLNNVSLIIHFQFNIIHFESRNPGRKFKLLSHYFTSGVKKRSSKRGRTIFLLVPKRMLRPDLLFPQSMIFKLINVSLITHFQFDIIHFENRNPGRIQITKSLFHLRGEKKFLKNRGRTIFLLFTKGMLKPDRMFPQSHDFSSQQCFLNHSLSARPHSFRKQESRPEIQLAKSLFHLRGEKTIFKKGTDFLFTLY